MKKTDKKSDRTALILAAKAGDGEAFEALSHEYGGMIGAQISSFRSSISSADPGADSVFSEEDLRQEAGIAFLRAVRTYDPEKNKGVTFGLYAKICVKNAMISLFRKQSARKKRRQRGGDIAETAEYRAAEEVDLGTLLEGARGTLSAFEADVLDMYVKGMKPRETAAELGVGEKTVYNALYRAKAKIRRLSERKK